MKPIGGSNAAELPVAAAVEATTATTAATHQHALSRYQLGPSCRPANLFAFLIAPEELLDFRGDDKICQRVKDFSSLQVREFDKIDLESSLGCCSFSPKDSFSGKMSNRH